MEDLDQETSQLLEFARKDSLMDQLPIEQVRQQFLAADARPSTMQLIPEEDSAISMMNNVKPRPSVRSFQSVRSIGSGSSSETAFDINNVQWDWKQRGQRVLSTFRNRFRIHSHQRRKVTAKASLRIAKKKSLTKGPKRWFQNLLRKRNEPKKSRSEPKMGFRLPSFRKPTFISKPLFAKDKFKLEPGNKILKVVETLAKIVEKEPSIDAGSTLAVKTEYSALLAMFRDSDDLLEQFTMDIDVLQQVLLSKNRDDERELAKAQRIVNELNTIVHSITQKITDYEVFRRLHFEKISDRIEKHKNEAEEYFDEFFHFKDLAFLELENKIVETLRRFDQHHEALYDVGWDLEHMQTQRTLAELLLDLVMGFVQILQGIINHFVILLLFHPAYRMRTLSWLVVFLSITMILYGNDLIDLSIRFPWQMTRFLFDISRRLTGQGIKFVWQGVLLPTIKIPVTLFHVALDFLEYLLPTAYLQKR